MHEFNRGGKLGEWLYVSLTDRCQAVVVNVNNSKYTQDSVPKDDQCLYGQCL